METSEYYGGTYPDEFYEEEKECEENPDEYDNYEDYIMEEEYLENN